MAAHFDVSEALARLTPGRPLLIVDADEVVLRFVDGFDRFLRAQELYLDLSTYRLHGNVKRLVGNAPILDVEVTALLDKFRRELDSLELVVGAREALAELARRIDIVVLSNISSSQAIARRRNLDALGFDLPLVCNTGAKGPAAQALASRAGRPVFFMDDIPQHLVSVGKAVPHALLIHIVGDDRLKPILPQCQEAHLRAADWPAALAFMQSHLEGKA